MRIYVNPYCRKRPYNIRAAAETFASERESYQRNYAPRGGWRRGVDKDLIDTKSLKDKTLTRRENNHNIKHMFDFKNLRI